VPKNERRKRGQIYSFAEQDYPDFEIVLIDDASSDNTLENLKNLKTIC
jgi:glycosyltransferase involved in cell wall biosynthesis